MALQMDLFSPAIRILQAAPAKAPAPAPKPAIMKIEDTAAEVPTTKSAARRIVDTGEKIKGARRDYHAQAMSVAELSDLNGVQKVELVTKDNVWPVPDYAALIESGMPVQTAALIKIVRDSLTKRPREDRKYTFDQIVEFYVQILTELRDEMPRANSVETVKLIAKRVHDTYHRMGLVAICKGRYSPLSLTSYDVAKADKLIQKGFPDDREGWRRGYLVRQAGAQWILYKAGRRVYDQPHHRSEEEVWTWLKPQVDRMREEKKASAPLMPSYPHLDKLDRIGPEMKTGVDPQDFIDTFGFRGVQFGNWVADKERQTVLDHAYAGLHDLCWLLQIEPRHLALQNALGIAFASRGRGGRAAAHYEPGERVVNMTKFTGAGRVAHEMWHGVDHWLGIIGHCKELENGGARFGTGHDHHRTDRHRELPNLKTDLVDGIVNLLSACASRTPSIEDLIKQNEAQAESAEKQIRLCARSIAMHLERNARSNKVIRAYEDDARTWNTALTAVNERLALLRQGIIPPGLINSKHSDFRRQAMTLDPKAKPYWSTPCELTARAFESWCFDRLADEGRVSEYLVHSVEEGRYAPPRYKADIYPSGWERKRINAAFDDLIPLIAREIKDRSS